MIDLFNGIFKNKTVLITGHTGFKGSWLSLWLKNMGANVIGYSLNIPTNPAHSQLLDLDIVSIYGDIRDEEKLNETFKIYNPDIVFHLAAQPLVRDSYFNPIETYEINVIGTLKIFEACRKFGTKVIINVTSDKAYENKESIWGYKETDELGGYDPYSSSKACSELLTSSYRNSYFNLSDYKKKHNTLLASCRAGNVIGGGDWAKDRLLVDIVQSANNNIYTKIRNPESIRPWQHVLEPLSGYLLVGQKLLEEQIKFSDAWNFGPPLKQNITVEKLLKDANFYWKNIKYVIIKDLENLHEANFLKLDCTKSYYYLNWDNVWTDQKTIEKTILWYKSYYERNQIETLDDLTTFIKDARKKNLVWTR